MEIDTGNYQLVSVTRGKILVLAPKQEMTTQEALVHAAWLVALSKREDEFPAILTAVQNT